MSLEHSPATDTAAQSGGSSPAPIAPEGDEDYWSSLIDEKAAANFLGMTDRFMQHRRQQGGGPRYVAVSSRCIRYRRHDLKIWADERVRVSTSDDGRQAA